LEAAARDARYALLASEVGPGECLLTGHHEDDQLETVLLQLFRGAGLAGLAAMPAITTFAGGGLARPLLSRTRAELEDWARGAGLSWIEDDTNVDESFDRNYLRRQVLPLIHERWKGVGSAVSRSARHAAEAQRLLDGIARTDVERASNGAELFVPTLRALQPDRRRNALRFWIMRSGVRPPDSSRLEELVGPVIDARPDANPVVAWGDVEVQRHADLLSMHIASARPRRRDGKSAQVLRRNGEAAFANEAGGCGAEAAPADQSLCYGGKAASAFGTESRGRGTVILNQPQVVVEWSWKTTPHLELGAVGGRLELKADAHGPIDLDALPERVTVSWRRGGERLRPRRGGPRRSLKSLLQESRLPLAQRARIPLIFSGPTLLAAGALWIDESIQATQRTQRRGRLIYRGRAG
jgi:tRNA(Ile)-lysidine synthetase-like protein